MQPVQPPYSVAVLPFEDYSNRPALSWLRQGLPDMLVTDLALLPGVRVVSRHRLGEVLREQWLQHRGSFEEASSVRLGRLVGARYLLSGIYYVAGKELILEVHLLDVEQGSVVRTFRVTGLPDAVPSLELELASQFGSVFGAGAIVDHDSNSLQGRLGSDNDDVPLNSIEIQKGQEEANILESSAQDSSPVSMTLRTDTILSLERLRQVRETAKLIADQVWTTGIAIQLGAPQYDSLSANGPVDLNALTVEVPVSATVREERMTPLSPRLQVMKGNSANGVLMAFDGTDSGAQRLFVEAMQAQRRVFVRAIRESGEVVAVSSEWSWRSDQHVQLRADGTVELTGGSQPFLSGHAVFTGPLIMGQNATMKFDAVIVPVPDETRAVSVEFIDDQDLHATEVMTASELVSSVRTWLLHRWAPPVAESIPTSGYLPGNRRRGVVTLSGVGGTIRKSQVIQVESESGFVESIRQLLTPLLGKCFTQCGKKSFPQAPLPKAFQLRVQFELIKDMRHVGLSRKI